MTEKDFRASLAPEYFEDVYNASDDPWNFATSDYEREKYAATLAALPRERYDSALEIGCSIGVLTEQLAARCNRLLAVDVNNKALTQARERCAALAHVGFAKMRMPDEMPGETFDLIVVSEVGYYLDETDWQSAQEKIVARLNPHGNIILVHWTHFVPDYPQTGDAVHDSFARRAETQLKHLKGKRTDDYRLDVWEK